MAAYANAQTPGPALQLPNLFTDGIVLQADTKAPIWGDARPGAPITVQGSWSDQTLRTQAGQSGDWRIDLPTASPGGPYTLTVSDGRSTLVINDVLLGEVWLAGGQSNMEMPVEYRSKSNRGAIGWQDIVAESDDPHLRIFDVENHFAIEEQSDVTGAWRAAAPDTTGNFSATAYFFAKDLRARLGVPVGVITASRGGTPAEAWTPLENLKRFESAQDAIEQVETARRHPGGPEALATQRRANWYNGLDDQDPGIAQRWHDGATDESWRTVQLPGVWEQNGLPAFNGLVWYRREIQLPAHWINQKLTLELGPIDDEDVTFANGAAIGATYGQGLWETPRRYTVPADANTRPTLTLATRVLDTGGGGGFHGEPEEMILRLEGTDETRPLAGPWQFRASTPLTTLSDQLGPRDTLGADTPSSLFNGMIAPLAPYRVRGTIWYQGESNRPRAEEYAELFPTLIQAWRTRFE
ncbi:MAG: sialate O-acetylesterase, partial [Planctomycetota bacterium]